MNHITWKFTASSFSPYKYFLLRSFFGLQKPKGTLDGVYHCQMIQVILKRKLVGILRLRPLISKQWVNWKGQTSKKIYSWWAFRWCVCVVIISETPIPLGRCFYRKRKSLGFYLFDSIRAIKTWKIRRLEWPVFPTKLRPGFWRKDFVLLF